MSTLICLSLSHLLLGGVDVGVAVVDVAHLVLEVVLGALGQAGRLGGSGQGGGQGPEAPGQNVVVVVVQGVVAEVAKSGVGVVVSWLVAPESRIVA